MNSTEFEAFAEAVSAPARPRPASSAVRFERVCVLGGGDDARMLAALCLAAGAEVTLFSAYGRELGELRTRGGVTLRGEGPIGTFAVDREDAPAIRTTAELDVAVAGAQLIFLTGPVHKQRTYAMVLADHLHDGQVLAIAPGRTLGAAEAAWLLRVGGCSASVTLVEAQGLPYWVRAESATLHLSMAASVSAATLPAGRHDVVDALARFLPNIHSVETTVHSGFADGSGLVEVPALLLGGPALSDGQPSLGLGGVALDENRTFRALIGAEHKALTAALAAERTLVARAFGVRELPGAEAWMDAHAGAASGAGARAVPSRAEAKAIVRCAAIGSLAPLASAGQVAGRATPVTDAMITLSSTVLQADVASAGRRLDSVGIRAEGIDDARRTLDVIANGGIR